MISRRAIIATALVTVATLAAVSLLAAGGDGAVEIELYIGALALVGAGIAVGAVARLLPLDHRPPRPLVPADEKSPTVAATKSEIRWQGWVAAGTTNARAGELRLRPALRSLADGRLTARHGITTDDRDTAAALVGPAAWAVLRNDQPVDPEVDRPGLGLDAIEATVTALENL